MPEAKAESISPVTPARAARLGRGSAGRIFHALGLGLLQPALPLFIFVGLGPLLFDAHGALEPPGGLSLAVTAAAPLVADVLLVGVGLIALGRVSLRELGWSRPTNLASELARALAGLAGYLAVYAAVVLTGPNAQETLGTALSYAPSTRVLLLTAGLHIAFFEETVFRGYLQPALISRLGLWGGVLCTAFIFAAWHPPHFSAAGFAVRLGLGLATGSLRGRDRPLLAPILTHALLWPVVGLA